MRLGFCQDAFSIHLLFILHFLCYHFGAMSELVLYRKYRPRSFDEVAGQRHVTDPIQNAIRMNRAAHAYLFSGPRGVGKTTVARLIAKALNCSGEKKPCNECSLCAAFNEGRAIDVIEIDAASNRGVEDMRDLREGVRHVPTQGKYKTYIIDEVHQLSKDAFSALLKTLEEPPPHAVFILATTEFDKVLPTVVSRTQHYDFRRPGVQEISARLLGIAKKERVDLDEDGARLIALSAEGSYRDAESILGAVMASEDKKITRREVEHTLGLPRRQAAKDMFAYIAKKNVPAALALAQDLHKSGDDLAYFSKLLVGYFRAAMFLKADPALKRFVEAEFLPDECAHIAEHLPLFGAGELSRSIRVISQNMSQFKKNPIPQLPLELSVIELAARAEAVS